MLVIHETDQFPLRKIMQLHNMLGHEIWRSKHFPPKQAWSNSMITYYSTKPKNYWQTDGSPGHACRHSDQDIEAANYKFYAFQH